MEAHEKHQQEMLAAFAQVVNCEERLSHLKQRESDFLNEIEKEKAAVAEAASSGWARIAALMEETGEVSVILPGAVYDYEIYRTAPRESVKVVDPTAVPDAFVKIERKPKLKEIGDYIRGQERAGLNAPNWASLEKGEGRLTHKAIKKTAKE